MSHHGEDHFDTDPVPCLDFITFSHTCDHMEAASEFERPPDGRKNGHICLRHQSGGRNHRFNALVLVFFPFLASLRLLNRRRTDKIVDSSNNQI